MLEPVEITQGIWWVGAIDWNERNFHGYTTERGSTYNAYLIVDEKVVLVDCVKEDFVDGMLDRVSSIVDPAKIDYIIANHGELDHSGGLMQVLEAAPNAKVVASNPQGVASLTGYFGEDLPLHPVKTGDTLDIGSRTLSFIQTPMAHWPDSMVTYSEADKTLFSMDIFGQHYASSMRFDHEVCRSTAVQQATKYYANIVQPFAFQVRKALDALEPLELDIIAPSHGVIWTEHIPDILAAYKRWSMGETKEYAIVVYDSMWHSTETMAIQIVETFIERNIPARLFDLQHNHMSDVISEALEARYVAVGSPTLNNNLMPSVAAFLTYLKGLSPKDRVAFGFAFGSYGWSGQSIGQVYEMMSDAGYDMSFGKFAHKWRPVKEDLAALKEQVLLGIDAVRQA